MRHPEYVNMVVFRENTEDIYTALSIHMARRGNKKFKAMYKEAFQRNMQRYVFPIPQP